MDPIKIEALSQAVRCVRPDELLEETMARAEAFDAFLSGKRERTEIPTDQRPISFAGGRPD